MKSSRAWTTLSVVIGFRLFVFGNTLPFLRSSAQASAPNPA